MKSRLAVILIIVFALASLTAQFATAGATNSDSAPTSAVAAVNLQTEYQSNPLGIDVSSPRLSWQLHTRRRATLQTAYQIQVFDRRTETGRTLIWDSGIVTSDASIQRLYAGAPLEARRRYDWQVRIWDNHGNQSSWSKPGWFELGLLDAAWRARWIGADAAPGQAPLFRRAFVLRGPVKRARIYATARGLYQLYLNGSRVSRDEFRPGFTSYNKRLQYQTYDVTERLQADQNVLGAALGEGWYAGGYTWGGKRRHLYGERTALLVQLEVQYADGTTDVIVTDEQWRTTPGPILHSSLYDGETYDARREEDGWDRPSFDDRHWSPVLLVEQQAKPALIAQEGPAVRRIQEIRPRQIIRRPNGRYIVDMGQNLAGWVRLSVKGRAGTQVTLRHGEVLTPQGELYTDNLMGAAQTVRYTLKGSGAERYEPHFTYQGFRYIEVDGYPGQLTADGLTAVVLHSDIEPAGEFSTSNSLLNRLQQNIVWGMKSNFLEIPTDNPQRAERMGWTADAQLFAPTAAFNAQVGSFFSKWLKDLAADQAPSGAVPWTVPDAAREMENKGARIMSGRMPIPPAILPGDYPEERAAAAVWGDAAVFLPWSLYLLYGDTALIETQYESMRRWVEYERRRAGADLIWDGDFQFGDWLDFGSENRWNNGATSSDLVATAYFCQSANVLAQVAKKLGKADDAKRYAELSSANKAAFQRRFVSPEGLVGAGTQTAQSIALKFDLLPSELRPAAARILADDVRRRGHLTTGLAGIAWLLPMLSDHGYLAEAYGLLLREDYPSWLYHVRRGATTMWERWDSIEPNGAIHTKTGMNSFNQYVLGSVGAWMYQTIGGIGIDPDQPGYKHILLRPRPGGGLTYATVSHSTPYGAVSSDWRIDAGHFYLTVVIPPNTTAAVRLPDARQHEVLEGDNPVCKSGGISAVRQAGPDVIVDLGSGRYVFRYPIRSLALSDHPPESVSPEPCAQISSGCAESESAAYRTLTPP